MAKLKDYLDFVDMDGDETEDFINSLSSTKLSLTETSTVFKKRRPWLDDSSIDEEITNSLYRLSDNQKKIVLELIQSF